MSHYALMIAICGGVLSAGPASAQDGTVQELDPISVEASKMKDRPPAEGFKADYSQNYKYTAPLIDTPHSVTVITREVMEETGSTSLQDTLRTVPGITLGMGEGGTPNADRPIIRGSDSMGSTFVDGVRDTGSQTREIFNLEQVEISKGPGSAYTGRSSAGGSINLITKKAKADRFVEGDFTFGTDMTKRATIDGNTMVTDDIAFRLNVMGHDGEVAGRDEVEVQRWGVAPSLSLGLNGPTRATINLYHLETDDIPDYGHPYDPNTGNPAVVDRDNFYGLTNRDFQKQNVNEATVTLEHDVNRSVTLRNLTHYSWSENDYIVTNPDDSRGNVPNGFVWRNTKSRNSDTETITNQTEALAEFETSSLKHSLIAGIEISRETVKSRGYTVDTGSSTCVSVAAPYNCTSLYNPDPNDPWTGSITPSSSSTHTRTDTKAAFVFDTIEITPSWLVNLGLRYDDYETSTDSGLRNTADFFSPQAGIVYKPLPFGSIYAAYSNSSQPSGYTGGDGSDNLSTSTQDLEPEETRSFEIGTKWDLFDEKLSVNAAVFRTTTVNARVATASGRGAPQETIGENRVDGFEFGVAGKVTEDLSIFGGYTYLDSEILDDGPANSNEGKLFPNTPSHSFSLWANYKATDSLSFGGGAFYVSRQYGDSANTKEIPPYWRFDATAAYRINENFRLQLSVLNLLDETYYTKAYTTHMVAVAPGRSALLSLNVKF